MAAHFFGEDRSPLLYVFPAALESLCTGVMPYTSASILPFKAMTHGPQLGGSKRGESRRLPDQVFLPMQAAQQSNLVRPSQ